MLTIYFLKFVSFVSPRGASLIYITVNIRSKVIIMTLYLRMALGVIHLWRPQKMTNFVTPTPLFFAKWTIVLFFKKKKRICKHVTNFKTRSTPFHMDVINVWSLALNNGPLCLSFCFRCILCSFQLRFSFKKAPRNFIDSVRSISWLFVFSFGKVSGILVFARFVEKQVFHFCFALFFFFFFYIKWELVWKQFIDSLF